MASINTAPNFDTCFLLSPICLGYSSFDLKTILVVAFWVARSFCSPIQFPLVFPRVCPTPCQPVDFPPPPVQRLFGFRRPLFPHSQPLPWILGARASTTHGSRAGSNSESELSFSHDFALLATLPVNSLLVPGHFFISYCFFCRPVIVGLLGSLRPPDTFSESRFSGTLLFLSTEPSLSIIVGLGSLATFS